MCWEKSFIPLIIWRSGDANSNLIESVHADVNREGISCTLVGGIIKGKAFDLMKLRTLKAQEMAGICSLYNSGHIVENATKSLKRKSEFNISLSLRSDENNSSHPFKALPIIINLLLRT